MTTEDELLAAHAVYKADLARAKAQAKQEMITRINELTSESLTALSQKVHSAHSEGMTKATINALLGVYSNAAQAKPIWDAYTPEKKIDLRVRNNSDSGDSIPDTIVTRHYDGSLFVALGGGGYSVINPVLLREGEDQWLVWDEPNPLELGDEYATVYSAVFEFLKRGEDEGGLS
ncbi:MAG: hypothetical protein M0R66_02245 [Candidatus Omnitrophica bacterium]|jgi:hypothetical protein|nr:hypothetical protein [Sphaerochaeta sp.]MCK9603189.1 hypothetical protein [Candidatus Omnitrophota bacterium]